MKKQLTLFLAVVSAVFAAAPLTYLGGEILKIAWRRPLGQPLDHPGVRKNNVDIDDGYWQGTPVGGFGAGTFSRTYRGDFARWHIKAERQRFRSQSRYLTIGFSRAPRCTACSHIGRKRC